MAYFSADIMCTKCGKEWDELLDREKRDDPVQCSDCQELTGIRVIRGVNFLAPSRHMGKDEFKRDKVRQNHIEATRIEKDSFNLPPNKRAEHKKEIKRLKSTKPDG